MQRASLFYVVLLTCTCTLRCIFVFHINLHFGIKAIQRINLKRTREMLKAVKKMHVSIAATLTLNWHINNIIETLNPKNYLFWKINAKRFVFRFCRYNIRFFIFCFGRWQILLFDLFCMWSKKTFFLLIRFFNQYCHFFFKHVEYIYEYRWLFDNSGEA